MKLSYSQYARDAHLMIQSLNDKFQTYIDRFDLEAGITGDYFHELKTVVYMSMVNLNDTLINYIIHMNYYFRGFDHRQKFQLSTALEELVDNQLDLVNANFDISHFSDIINHRKSGHINIKMLYDDILSDVDKLTIYEDPDDRLYTTNDLLNIIDILFSEYYDCFNSLRNLCRKEETDILYMINYYIFNIRIISYIIEFVESIRVV